MNTRLVIAFSRHILVTLVATVSASAALLSVQSAATTVQGSAGPYTQGAVAKADPCTQGATTKYGVYTQGTDRQANTYDYLLWENDHFGPYTQGAVGRADPYTDSAIVKADPYTDGATAKYGIYAQGTDRQTDTYGYLPWSDDVSYPKDVASQA